MSELIVQIIFSALGCLTLTLFWGVSPETIGLIRFVLGWTFGVILLRLGEVITE